MGGGGGCGSVIYTYKEYLLIAHNASAKERRLTRPVFL